MRSCRAERVAAAAAARARGLLALACVLVACANGPLPRTPWVRQAEPIPETVPDDLELQAGRLAALVLADRDDSAFTLLGEMQARENARRQADEAPSGLIDDSRDLVYSGYGRAAYLDYAEEALGDGDPDTELERRMERELEQEPLEIAESRLSDDRNVKYGSIANRLLKPASQFLMFGTHNPFEAGSVALSSLLIVKGFPEATVQERQALAAYQEFLDRHPDSPEAPEVLEKVERYQRERRQHEHEEALAAAHRAFNSGHAGVTLVHLRRAENLVPGDEDVAELRSKAERVQEVRLENARRLLQASAVIGAPLDAQERALYLRFVQDLLLEPLSAASRGPEGLARHPALHDEFAYVENLGRIGRGEESEYFRTLDRLGDAPTHSSNMARHARYAWLDPAQNPYRTLQAARRADTSSRVRWVMFGRRANGAIRRGVWRPLEWILDAPGTVFSIVSFPLRLLKYPTARARFGGPVIREGEAYLARFPRGEHSEGVRDQLESLYGTRGQWSQALAVQRDREHPDPKRIARYRDRIAERTLAAARSERRFDVRASIYKSIVQEYGDTKYAQEARDDLAELFANYSPQSVRLSREFLEENPELWAPGALSLRPELFDGEDDNGELAEDGITLVGSNLIRIPIEGHDPVTERIPEDNLARTVALLEEITRDQLLEDDRESAVLDPQRDLFFERARLGLTDDRPDLRPTAGSEAVFLGKHEKFGSVRQRDSLLPLELVLQGGLEDFGFAAFPRLKLPRRTPDANLYE